MIAGFGGIERLVALEPIILTPVESPGDWSFVQHPQPLLEEMTESQLEKLSAALDGMDLSVEAELTTRQRAQLQEALWRNYLLAYPRFSTVARGETATQARMLWEFHVERRLFDTGSFDRRMHYMIYGIQPSSRVYLYKDDLPFDICGNLSSPLAEAENQNWIDQYRIDLMRLALGDAFRARTLRAEMGAAGRGPWTPHPEFYWFVFQIAEEYDDGGVNPRLSPVPPPALATTKERRQLLQHWLKARDIFALVNSLPHCRPPG